MSAFELQEQIDRLGLAVERFVASVVALSEASFRARLNGWSTREIVAHLIGWNRYVVRGSQQIQRGELPFYDIDPGHNYSKVNAVLVRQYDSTDREALFAELEASARELREFLHSLDAADWSRDFGVRHGGSRVTIRNTVDELIEDYDHHRRQIADWAQKSGAVQAVSKRRVVQQLRDLGVRAGDVLMVHCSFSRVGPVEGGPSGLIWALLEAVGPEGTLVMPSMTDDDDHPFDPEMTPCRGMGILADTFWRSQGVLRSASPHAFAAFGPEAARITMPHPVDPPHGADSPVGRVHELVGQILLLGVGHDANTTIHLAENLAGVRYRRRVYVTILEGGRPTRFDYSEVDHCCQNFALADEWLEPRGLQRRGQVGHAQARLMRSRDLVDVVCEQLRLEETVFLHPYGVDRQCDEAHDSLERLQSESAPA